MFKKILISITAFFMLSGLCMAQDLPDLHIADFQLVPCSQEDIDEDLTVDQFHTVEEPDGTTTSYATGYADVELENIADDKSYYDVKNTETKMITRHFCYDLTIGNQGTADYSPSGGDSTPDEEFTYTGYGYSIYSGLLANSFASKFTNYLSGIPAGEEITLEYRRDEFPIQRAINNSYCISFFVDLEYSSMTNEWNWLGRIDESNEDNNISQVCFDLDEYDLPGQPQNLRITSVSNDSFDIEWDTITDAEYYFVDPFRAIGAGEDFGFHSVTETTATIPVTSDDLYCVSVNSVKNDLSGKETADVCYGRTLPVFNDVGTSVWYFGFLQKMQNKDIIQGYTDNRGELTGTYGPSNNLTVAECLKIVLNSMDIPLDVDNQSIPANLNSHWATEFFKKGKDLNLSILSDLNNLNPDRSVTRAELITMFWEATKITPPETTEYTATDISNTPAKNGIQLAYDLGIVSGNPDNTFRPNNEVNRAEITKITANMMMFFGK